MAKVLYYKSFDENLCGYGGYQFEIGRTYETETKDTWNWYHFAAYASATLIYYKENLRICEVEPLGKKKFFHDHVDGFCKGYYTTNEIRIVRELSRDDLFDVLIAEKCPLHLMLPLKPPYEILLQFKKQLRGTRCYDILRMDYLTPVQKQNLLPKVWHKYIRQSVRET